jgi:hypothetical protein
MLKKSSDIEAENGKFHFCLIDYRNDPINGLECFAEDEKEALELLALKLKQMKK